MSLLGAYSNHTSLQTEIQPLQHEFMGYRAIVTNDTEYQINTHHLRHKVYCEELNWVPVNEERLEFDAMDTSSIHFAVVAPDNRVVACFRVTDNTNKWLVEKHFIHTVSKNFSTYKSSSSIEGTRLAIDPQYRLKEISDGVSVLDMIITIMVDYSHHILKKQKLLFTITPMMGILLKRRKMKLEQLGPIVTMADGCKVATYLGDLAQMSNEYPQYQIITATNTGTSVHTGPSAA